MKPEVRDAEEHICLHGDHPSKSEHWAEETGAAGSFRLSILIQIVDLHAFEFPSPWLCFVSKRLSKLHVDIFITI